MSLRIIVSGDYVGVGAGAGAGGIAMGAFSVPVASWDCGLEKSVTRELVCAEWGACFFDSRLKQGRQC